MAKKNVPPLFIERQNERMNYLFLSLLEYKRKEYLVIIDNILGNEISAYVLEQSGAENVDINWLLTISTRWYYESSERYPLSFEFNKLGLTEKVSPLLKTFKIDYVSRLIGEVFTYDVNTKPKVKRKKVSIIPSTIEIKLKKVANIEDYKN